MQGITFTGQGSQHIRMGADLIKQFPNAKTYIEQTHDALNINLWDIIQSDQTKLNQTYHAQPAIFLISFMLWSILKQERPNLSCQIMAGHSLGEYTGLCAAQSLQFSETIKLIYHRGRLMQQTCNNGAMAAVLKMSQASLEKICHQINSQSQETLNIACLNAPDQIVIAGTQAGIQAAKKLIESEKNGVKIILLPISVPSHCTLMKPAADNFGEFLEPIDFKKPQIPIINNTKVAIENEPEKIKMALIKQLISPVRWIETIEKMQSKKIETIIEIGPKQTLTNLNKKIAKNATHLAICDANQLLDFLASH